MAAGAATGFGLNLGHGRKARLANPVDLYVTEEHRVRPHPITAAGGQGAVQHQRLQGLAVAHDAQHLVLAALVMAVAPQGRCGQQFKVFHGWAG